MQGSHQESQLHDQGYREKLKQLITTHFIDAEIYDPWADHNSSLEYDDERGRAVFFGHNRLCREVDVLIAYVPQASMGTAIEMWEAHEHGRACVISISPLDRNWAVRFCSHLIYSDLSSFEQAMASGEVARRIASVNSATVDDGP